MLTTSHNLVCTLTAFLFDISLLIDAGDIESYHVDVTFEVLVDTGKLHLILRSKEGTLLLDKQI